MVVQALKLQALYDRARPGLEADDPQRFAAQWRRLLTDAQDLL